MVNHKLSVISQEAVIRNGLPPLLCKIRSIRKICGKNLHNSKRCCTFAADFKKTLIMKTTSYTQVEYFSNPPAHVVELVKKLRERKEQGLARLRKEMGMS